MNSKDRIAAAMQKAAQRGALPSAMAHEKKAVGMEEAATKQAKLEVTVASIGGVDGSSKAKIAAALQKAAELKAAAIEKAAEKAAQGNSVGGGAQGNSVGGVAPGNSVGGVEGGSKARIAAAMARAAEKGTLFTAIRGAPSFDQPAETASAPEKKTHINATAELPD